MGGERDREREKDEAERERERERDRMSTVCCSVSWCQWCYRVIYIPRALKI